jgi:hypothetical protein
MICEKHGGEVYPDPKARFSNYPIEGCIANGALPGLEQERKAVPLETQRSIKGTCPFS